MGGMPRELQLPLGGGYSHSCRFLGSHDGGSSHPMPVVTVVVEATIMASMLEEARAARAEPSAGEDRWRS